MTADAAVIDIPADVRSVFYNGDEIIDSLKVDGDIVKAGHSEFALLISEISVSDDLLSALNVYGLSHIYRRLPCTPEDAIGDPSTYFYFDFSVYYEAFFMSPQEIVSTKSNLGQLSQIRDVHFAGKSHTFWEDPPQPPPPYCSGINPTAMDLQWPLHPINAGDTLFGSMGFVDGWRYACDVFDPYAPRGVTVGVLDQGFGSGPDFHPDLRVHPLSRVKFEEIPFPGVHGTSVAGVIASSTFDVELDPNQGEYKSGYQFDPDMQIGGYLQGGAPKSSVLLVDTEDDTGWEDDLWYMLDVADSAGMKVINFSTSPGLDFDPAIADLLSYAHYIKGIEIVAAAGNCFFDFQSGWICNYQVLPGSMPFAVTVANCNWWAHRDWIPAFAAMTEWGGNNYERALRRSGPSW